MQRITITKGVRESSKDRIKGQWAVFATPAVRGTTAYFSRHAFGVTAYDFGILVRLPVVDLADHLTGRELQFLTRREKYANFLRPVFDLAAGVAWNNRSDDIIGFGDVSQDNPLPANRTAGWATTIGLEWLVEQWHLDLVKLTYTAETYTPQIDGADNTGAADDKSGYE